MSRLMLDEQLPDYCLPEQMSDYIQSGKYSNVEEDITRTNYVSRMHNLLYLEEFQQQFDLRR